MAKFIDAHTHIDTTMEKLECLFLFFLHYLLLIICFFYLLYFLIDKKSFDEFRTEIVNCPQCEKFIHVACEPETIKGYYFFILIFENYNSFK